MTRLHCAFQKWQMSKKCKKKKQRDVAIFYGPSIRSRFVSLQMQNVKMTREQFKISGHSNRVHISCAWACLFSENGRRKKIRRKLFRFFL